MVDGAFCSFELGRWEEERERVAWSGIALV